MHQTMDHITIIPSRRFLQILKELKNAYGAPDSIKEKLSSDAAASDTINLTTNEIKWCHGKMRERGISARVHELISESEIVLPKYEPPPRNPELEARVQKLRLEQENREYRNMTKSIDAKHLRDTGGLGEIGRDLRTLNRQLVSGVQYLLSVVGTFFAIFIALGMVTPEYGVRALIATISALVVGIAEMYFLIRDDLREEKQLNKEGKNQIQDKTKLDKTN